MHKFRGMDKYGFIVAVLVFFIISITCNASLIINPPKLFSAAPSNVSTNSQVSPMGSPISGRDETNTTTVNAHKSEKEKHKESQISNQNNSSSTLGSKGSKKKDNDNKNTVGTGPSAGVKIGDGVDKGNVNNGSCEGSLRSCRDKEMLACIEALKDGSKNVQLVVQNEGESSLKVNVNFPNSLENALPAFDVPKHQTKRIDASSTVGRSTKLILNSGYLKCELQLVRPVSVDNFILQFSFYSKQVTPIYATFAFFLLAVLFGGTWASCKLRKRNRKYGNQYQELEMGLPESTCAVNVDTAEGWDHNWDDDWDEDIPVKSPGGHQVRSISADGLVSRSSKKDGWENDWED